MALGVLSDLQDVRHLEIRLGCRRGTDKECLVHVGRVLGELVSLRVDTDCLHAESVRRAGHTARDLATVGDQKLFEHICLIDSN